MLGLSQEAKVSVGLVSELESDTKKNPSIETLAKLAEAMSTRASVLLKKLEEARKS